MEKVIFSEKMGEGIILKNDETLALKNIAVVLGNETLQVGEKYKLHWALPLEFKGVLDKNILVFLIGEHTDFFDSTHYFQTINKITDKRFFVMYSYNAGRDFNFINNEWK